MLQYSPLQTEGRSNTQEEETKNLEFVNLIFSSLHPCWRGFGLRILFISRQYPFLNNNFMGSSFFRKSPEILLGPDFCWNFLSWEEKRGRRGGDIVPQHSRNGVTLSHTIFISRSQWRHSSYNITTTNRIIGHPFFYLLFPFHKYFRMMKISLFNGRLSP